MSRLRLPLEVSAPLLTAYVLGVLSAMPLIAHPESLSTKKSLSQLSAERIKTTSLNRARIAHASHHLLAMAHQQNLEAFSRTLCKQVEIDPRVDVEFARTAVAEMRRSSTCMKQHHQNQVAAENEESQSNISELILQMERYQIELNVRLTALEREVQLGLPDPLKVAALAANLSAHLSAFSKLHPDRQDGSVDKPLR